ncbi:YfiT family bacillithiol transferase [Dyadobacter sp. CY323]|uniref:YfiT family bacillithiol transferase n=1 Tax=Dyadobacter sp. CY323 TaxID=2907302 RepID=UPI001F31DF1C|nr:putative metal-dependent hydrolase [Dyadobacter sp. CY323]MCE6992991.1 putative metal-dependent hydrolase [Dyadobacter sp. CY323]
MTDRKFPIGPFAPQENYSEEELANLISVIESAPADYRNLVTDLSETDLNKTYREGSWTVKQLIHHVADIHLLHFFRMKQALTDPDYKDVTLINMDGWAKTPEASLMPIDVSLTILESIGTRYVYLAKTLTPEQFEIAYFHPVRKIWLNQRHALAMSAWHVTHHFAHINLALGKIDLMRCLRLRENTSF